MTQPTLVPLGREAAVVAARRHWLQAAQDQIPLFLRRHLNAAAARGRRVPVLLRVKPGPVPPEIRPGVLEVSALATYQVAGYGEHTIGGKAEVDLGTVLLVTNGALLPAYVAYQVDLAVSRVAGQINDAVDTLHVGGEGDSVEAAKQRTAPAAAAPAAAARKDLTLRHLAVVSVLAGNGWMTLNAIRERLTEHGLPDTPGAIALDLRKLCESVRWVKQESRTETDALGLQTSTAVYRATDEGLQAAATRFREIADLIARRVS